MNEFIGTQFCVDLLYTVHTNYLFQNNYYYCFKKNCIIVIKPSKKDLYYFVWYNRHCKAFPPRSSRRCSRVSTIFCRSFAEGMSPWLPTKVTNCVLYDWLCFWMLLCVCVCVCSNRRMDPYSKNTTVIHQIFGGYHRSEGTYMCVTYLSYMYVYMY